MKAIIRTFTNVRRMSGYIQWVRSCISAAHFRDYYYRNARLYTRQRCNSRTIVAFAYNLSSMLFTIDIPVSHTINPRSNTESPLSTVYASPVSL